MSAYIVGDETIDKIVSHFVVNDFVALKVNDETKAGRKLLNLNIDSTEQRYPDNHFLSPEERKERVKNYSFKRSDCSLIRAYKALQCFLYQSCEGNCEKRKIFKYLSSKQHSWAYEIVDKLPEYEKAEWG